MPWEEGRERFTILANSIGQSRDNKLRRDVEESCEMHKQIDILQILLNSTSIDNASLEIAPLGCMDIILCKF